MSLTRKEQLAFCKKCTKRQFEEANGIICSLTGQKAAFADVCMEFDRDPAVKDIEIEKTAADGYTNAEVINQLPEWAKVTLKKHESIGFALLGGFLVSLFAGILWAIISVTTAYQISFMAIGVGLMVGYVVRYFGAGISPVFSVIVTLYALLGCLLGNLFTQVGFAANEEGLSYLETLAYINTSNFLTIMFADFSLIDLLFYALALAEGYKFSIRKISANELKPSDLKPQLAVLRMPLAIVSATAIGLILFIFNQMDSGEKINYYESGKIYSQGNLNNGLMIGEWKFFYENGSLGAIGNLADGKETGKWEFYDEDGILTHTSHFESSLMHGEFQSYYGPELKNESGNYIFGRLSGKWKQYYPNGTLLYSGEFTLDMPSGNWEYYYENGKLSSKGEFIAGEKSGLWQSWNDDGLLQEEIFHKTTDDFEIIQA